MAKEEMDAGARSDSDVAGMAMAKGRTVAEDDLEVDANYEFLKAYLPRVLMQKQSPRIQVLKKLVYVAMDWEIAEHVEASYDPIIDKSFTDGEIDEGKEQAEGPTVALDLTQKFEEAVSDEEAMGSNDEQVPEIDEGKEQAEGPTVALDLTQKFEEAVSDEEAMGSNDEQVPCKAYPVWAYILCWKFFKPSWYVARMWWLFQV
eukprot:s2783_g4.t1